MNSAPPRPPQSEKPATLRQIAQLAGVSLMTVSRALGNRPRVAEATRRSIMKIAQRIGYHPDPEISKIMHHLRRGTRPQFQSVICGITDWPEGAKPSYFESLLAGAARQARLRGYGFSVEQRGPEPRDGSRLQRVLRSRGVQGVILLPQRAPADLSNLLDWRDFSVVATSITVTAPGVNRTAPHHFENTLQLCRELTLRGYRRIGLVIARDHDARVNHAFTAAVMSHARHEAREGVAPLAFQGNLAAVLPPWFERERPDVIVAANEASALESAGLLRLKIPGPVGFATTSVNPAAGGARVLGGIDELPEDIGTAAVDLVASMIERRVRGLPKSPTSTLLTGRWRAGRSVGRKA